MNKSRILIAGIALAGLLSSVGCFSYHKDVSETPAPTVVEPAPATTVVTPPVTQRETTTTTTTDSPPTVQSERSSSSTTTVYP